MRLFIAIELPESLKREIGNLQDRLKQGGAGANWTRPEGIHLTLKFLGEVEESRVAAIEAALAATCRGTGWLQLEVMGAGAFPNTKAPRVLWVGVRGETEKLQALQAAVENAMTALEFEPEERKFSPHLTLARIKFPNPRDNWQQRIAALGEVNLGGFKASAVSLMKSELRRDGAVYTEITRVDLAKEA